jgi:hypothetical protein
MCFVIFAFVVSNYSRQKFGLRHSQPLLFLWMGTIKFAFIQEINALVVLLFYGNHPDVSRNFQSRVVFVKHNLIYLLITIRLATCFDPVGLSSGLHYEPTNVRKLRTLLGSQEHLQR